MANDNQTALMMSIQRKVDEVKILTDKFDNSLHGGENLTESEKHRLKFLSDEITEDEKLLVVDEEQWKEAFISGAKSEICDPPYRNISNSYMITRSFHSTKNTEPMENNEDNRQMTVIAEAIHILDVEISNWSIRRYNASHSMNPRSTELEDAAIEKREYAKGILESHLPKEEKYIREIIDVTWQEAYDDKQVPSTATQDKIIRSVNETFKTK